MASSTCFTGMREGLKKTYEEDILKLEEKEITDLFATNKVQGKIIVTLNHPKYLKSQDWIHLKNDNGKIRFSANLGYDLDDLNKEDVIHRKIDWMFDHCEMKIDAKLYYDFLVFNPLEIALKYH